MEKNLVSRTQFAKIAGITPSGVTKAALRDLEPAVSGKYIDAAHPAAVAFVEKMARRPTPESAGKVPGIDPLYEKAIEVCREHGKWGQDFLRAHFRIGAERAQRLAALLRATKAKEKALEVPPPPKPEKKTPHVRGSALLKQKRIEADDEELEEIQIPDNILKFADLTLREVIKKYGTAERFVDYLKALKEIQLIAEREIKMAEIKGQLVSRYLVQTQIVEQFEAAHIKLLMDGAKTISVKASALCAAGATTEEIEKMVAEKITDFIRPVKSKIERALKNGN